MPSSTIILSVLLGLAVAAVAVLTVLVVMRKSKMSKTGLSSGKYTMSVEGAGSGTADITALATFPSMDKGVKTPSGAKFIGAITVDIGPPGFLSSNGNPSTVPSIVYLAYDGTNYYFYFNGVGWMGNGASDEFITKDPSTAGKITLKPVSS